MWLNPFAAFNRIARAHALVRQCEKGNHLWDKSSDRAPDKRCLVCGKVQAVKRRKIKTEGAV